jgi:hypothetical protein
MTTSEQLGWEIALAADLSFTGFLDHPGDRERLEDLTWAGMSCLVYLLQFGHQDPVGQVVRSELERIKDVWNPEPEWN